jgi:hypothetical protein
MTETETKWAERVREWRESGEGAKEFATGRSYKASTLQWWASELRHRAGGGSRQGKPLARGTIAMARVVAFRPRNPTGAATQGVVVEVSGARIALARGFDAELFSEVVRALAGAR